MFCWFYVWQGNISQPWSLSTTWNSRILYTLKNSINWKMFLIRILNIIYACTNKLCICEQAIYDWKQNWNIWHGSLYLHAFVYKMVSYISIYYIFTLSNTRNYSMFEGGSPSNFLYLYTNKSYVNWHIFYLKTLSPNIFC